MKGPITSSHIPVYQPYSHSIKHSNTKVTNNGLNAELQPSKTNPFHSNKINVGESIASDSFRQSKLEETSMKPISSPIAISSSLYGRQFSPNLSRKSSMNERDHNIESQSPMISGSFVRSPLQTSIRNIETVNHAIQSTNSSPPVEPRNEKFIQTIDQLNYDYMQSETPTVTLDHQGTDHHIAQSASPQMLHFQQIEERMVDQLNELYKATMLIHSNQRDTLQRLEHDETQHINQHYSQHEQTFIPGKYVFQLNG